MRTPFQRDRDRIMHSKSFRRLKGKTQVFIDPAGDHIRTRMTHTLETTAISRVVARALRLNEDLAEAIGLGHDVGHPPFGHAGEHALDALLNERYGRRFRHNEQSRRIVDLLERDGSGLNLTREVCDGILKHTGPTPAGHAGGQDRAPRRPRRLHQPRHRRRVSRRAGSCAELPCRARSHCSATPARDASTGSSTTWSRPRREAGDILQSDEIGEAMLSLRSFMFDRVYLGPHGGRRACPRARRRGADLRPPRRAPRARARQPR